MTGEIIKKKPTKNKGIWKDKVYSKLIMERANQVLKPDELVVYEMLFNSIAESNNLTAPAQLMMLDNAVYDYLRIKRIQSIIMKEGDMIVFQLRGGRNITKAHEASYLLSAIEVQFRNSMKELLLTPKEITKKQIGMGAEDFASWLEGNTVKVEYKVEDEKK